jgi:hypothetical protein
LQKEGKTGQENKAPEKDKSWNNWIPAFAGMTEAG